LENTELTTPGIKIFIETSLGKKYYPKKGNGKRDYLFRQRINFYLEFLTALNKSAQRLREIPKAAKMAIPPSVGTL